MIRFQDIKNNETIRLYIERADESLAALGYTEHSFVHVTIVSGLAGHILKELGYSERDVELAKIAGYLHDIGNVINRVDHAQSGAVMAFRLLDQIGMAHEDIATIISAIGNHDENTAVPVNAVAAALILADKTDVRRTRVRNPELPSFDIHDRVNYAVLNSKVSLVVENTVLRLTLTIDTKISPVIDYFEIFLNRMILCRKAAEYLKLDFELIINEQKVL